MNINPDNPDHLRATPGDPVPTDVHPSTDETTTAPKAASETESAATFEAVAEIPSRPWESGLEHRQRGRRSAAALTVVPVDGRRAPSPPPERLTEAEKALWQELIASRRSNWFVGAEVILECYCTTVSHLQRVETWLAEVRPDDERYVELMRIRLGLVGQLCSVATKLRLVPSSRLDRRTPPIGVAPVA